MVYGGHNPYLTVIHVSISTLIFLELVISFYGYFAVQQNTASHYEWDVRYKTSMRNLLLLILINTGQPITVGVQVYLIVELVVAV